MARTRATLDREAISKLSEALQMLRSNGFESLLEATVYFIVVEAELAGSYIDISTGAQRADAPISTFSKVVWTLYERGLIRYEPDVTDRRRKVLRANLDMSALGA